MAFVAIAPKVYLADDLARVIDLPNTFRGQKIQIVPFYTENSNNCVPFETEKEMLNWMENAVSEWWDDETV